MVCVTSAIDTGKSVCLCDVNSDVNECADLSRTTAAESPCGPGTVCVNTPGSYRCSDPTDEGCMDADPATGQCLDVRSGFCQPGMMFDLATEQCVGEQKYNKRSK